MAVPIKPALARSYGNEAWGFATAVADIDVPLLTELNAMDGFNASCSLFGDQGGLSVATDKVNLPLLLCETVQFEVNGASTVSMADLVVSIQPQAASGSNGKKAWETLEDNAVGFLWYRPGVSSATDLANGQFVTIIPGQLGTKFVAPTATDASGVYAFTVGVSVTGTVAQLVEIGGDSSSS